MSDQHYKKWTPEEDEILIKNYQKIHQQELTQLLINRTINGIAWRASRLNLKSPVKLRKKEWQVPLYEQLAKQRQSTKLYLRNKRQTEPRWCMFHNAKHRAKQQNIPFDIKINDITIPKMCPIFKKPFIFGANKSLPFSPSLDRKNPKLGYTKDNIWVISHKANRIKNNATKEEIKIVATALEELL